MGYMMDSFYLARENDFGTHLSWYTLKYSTMSETLLLNSLIYLVSEEQDIDSTDLTIQYYLNIIHLIKS